MSEKKRVVAVCPNCERGYWQEVPNGYDGPRKTPRKRDVALRAKCDMADDAGHGREVYYLMRCTDCSIRLAPPSLRPTLEKWLREGEQK